MQVLSRLAFSVMLLATPALAGTNIAIIDSGVDYKHKDLAGLMWTNPTPGVDMNGKATAYAGDVNGWNFADNNNLVIDYTYLGTFPQDDYDFFAAQSRILQGTASDADKKFYADHKADAAFIKAIEVFGNFVHGTHVSGISAAGNSDARIMPIKVIATKQPGSLLALARAQAGVVLGGGAMDDTQIKYYIDMAAKQLSDSLTKSSTYAAGEGAKVANGSFGVSEKAEEPQIANLLQELLGRAPTPAETTQWSEYLVADMVTDLQEFVQAAPDTIFCFAAGNDGTDNDAIAAAPSNDKADNTIAVAATLGTVSLATFSNYGATMVEVAAPGVAIDSTIPGDLRMQLSGTSMAAPYVTNTAARIRGANPALKPADVKKILMDTVDVKAFLSGKVVTSGIVNQERAAAAAKLSLVMPLAQAIAAAHDDVADMPATANLVPGSEAQIFVLPLPNPLL